MGGQFPEKYNDPKIAIYCVNYARDKRSQGQGKSQGVLKKVIGNSSFLANLLIVFCILFCRMPTTT